MNNITKIALTTLAFIAPHHSNASEATLPENHKQDVLELVRRYHLCIDLTAEFSLGFTGTSPQELEQYGRRSLPRFQEYPWVNSQTNCAKKFDEKLAHLAADLPEQDQSAREGLKKFGRTAWLNLFAKERELLLQTKQKAENS
jgi:hypothetical protein